MHLTQTPKQTFAFPLALDCRRKYRVEVDGWKLDFEDLYNAHSFTLFERFAPERDVAVEL